MRVLTFFLVASLSLLTAACDSSVSSQSGKGVKVGAKVLLDKYLTELEGKRVGLVMNPTARVDGRHMLDTLLAEGVNITALFAAEHGFRGDAGAGETIEDGYDQATGLPVFSLYGKTRKPTEEMLSKVDLLLFDMQDVGARFYTYNVTMGNVLQAAAENNVPFWVLDRPNPAGGNYISGWMLEEHHSSFVGAYPIPMAHGMTLGELAQMMAGEGWLENVTEDDLRVIPMEGWERNMKWPDTGLEWIPPSPNLPTFDHAYAYLGTVLFEGTNVSEGRGTDDPFLIVGSPDTKLTSEHISELQKRFPGVKIERTTFQPESIPGKALSPKLEGEVCKGVRLRLMDYDSVDPTELGSALLSTLLDATPSAEINNYMPKLSGIDNDALRKQLDDSNFLADWKLTEERFREQRKPYLLYD
jgi:uncharacterized protein YbbC (DUF1343 family)